MIGGKLGSGTSVGIVGLGTGASRIGGIVGGIVGRTGGKVNFGGSVGGNGISIGGGKVCKSGTNGGSLGLTIGGNKGSVGIIGVGVLGLIFCLGKTDFVDVLGVSVLTYDVVGGFVNGFC